MFIKHIIFYFWKPTTVSTLYLNMEINIGSLSIFILHVTDTAMKINLIPKPAATRLVNIFIFMFQRERLLFKDYGPVLQLKKAKTATILEIIYLFNYSFHLLKKSSMKTPICFICTSQT